MWTNERALEVVGALGAFVRSSFALNRLRPLGNFQPDEVVNELYTRLAESQNAASAIAACPPGAETRILVFTCAKFHLRNFVIRKHFHPRARFSQWVERIVSGIDSQHHNGQSLSEHFSHTEFHSQRLDYLYIRGSLPQKLTAIADLLGSGRSASEIARILQVSPRTIQRAVAQINAAVNQYREN